MKKHSVEYAPELTSEQLGAGNLVFFTVIVAVLTVFGLIASWVM